MDVPLKLISNLRIAIQKLKLLGKHQDLLSHYESAEDLAAFIEKQISLLTTGTISTPDLEELNLIFAPSSDWDDYVGDVDLGEDIFQDLKILMINLRP